MGDLFGYEFPFFMGAGIALTLSICWIMAPCPHEFVS